MPEYLAPGVFIEEVSYRSKSIEGVGTTTTGFIGPTRYGPVDLEPDVITSVGEFERVYGDRQQLAFGDPDDKKKPKIHNYMWHAVRAFFEEGGKRLYVSRTFEEFSETNDGHAKAFVPKLGAGETDLSAAHSYIKISARFPGELGRMRVRLTLQMGQSILGTDADNYPTVGGLLDGDIVYITNAEPNSSPPVSPPPKAKTGFYLAQKNLDPDTGEPFWEFLSINGIGSPPDTLFVKKLKFDEGDKIKNLHSDGGDKIQVITLSVTTLSVSDPDAVPQVWSGLALDPQHKRAGTPDSIFDKFAARPANARDASRLPIIIKGNDTPSLINGKVVQPFSFKTGTDVLQLLFSSNSDLERNLADSESTDVARSIDLLLDGGNDGVRPTADKYKGTASDDEPFKTGLRAFEDIEDISIVAAPGSTFGFDNGFHSQASTITGLLISHAERMRYRIAVLDSGNDQAISEVRAMKARLDSKYAAFYYPWIKVLDPVTQQEINLPPSGFVAGIYARNDVERAVYKAPANEVVRLAIGFEKTLNKAQQEVLNPEGINCFRFFEGRGFRLWGARTISSDPEWKYVNLRRYFAYLERSIDRGTQWAVFEPNGDALWANVRQTIQDFLYNEWVSGALLGEKPEKAYFVRCDRSTMTQNDLDNGRLVCQIGLAVVKPAEFVIFRIGQWTADRKA